MNKLASIVSIDRRFARSARLDADLNGTPPLVGYVLQASVAKALRTLAESQRDNQQSAFTWTGPYGGGKSSAALLLANLVAGLKKNKKIAREIAGEPLTQLFTQAFPEKDGPWKIVAVTGSRMKLRDAIVAAASASFGWSVEVAAQNAQSDELLIKSLLDASNGKSSGTLLILDELGKLLEHEALEGGDVHLLQDLAEHASRSNGRLVVIGILHQSFDQYTARASREARQEWRKVQGRYQDIGFLSGADETVALLGRAIAAGPSHQDPSRARVVAEAVAKRRPTDIDVLTGALVDTWPLNPVSALLLGPISRARFAQNERSVFGFLSSAEPSGFQEFLANADIGSDSYDPSMLWDYLAANFGMALTGGPDGNRFSLAFEAIERAGAKGGTLHVALTKAAAIIEFFRNGSGVVLADDFLFASVPHEQFDKVERAIKDLVEWAILIRQPRLGGYALFAGSDFDLEEAINRAIQPADTLDLEGIPRRVGFGFATAKRHYFQKGALRNFEIALQVVSPNDTPGALAKTLLTRPQHGSGLLVLLLGDGSFAASAVNQLAQKTAEELTVGNKVIGIGGASESLSLRSTASELLAVERVFREHPQLEGDRIARRAIAARQSHCIDQLQRTLETAFENASWYLSPLADEPIQAPLTVVASALADVGFSKAPVIKSELLQRDKPSSNSMAALRELAHAMVTSPELEQLGMTQYPAELGLYLTLLRPFGLHKKINAVDFGFSEPDESAEGQSLWPAWEVIDQAGDKPLDAVYAEWARPPFGIKAGVMPVLALAYMLAKQDSVAVYIDGVYQTTIDDVVVDRLLQKPSLFRLRRIDRSVRETAFLSGLAQLLGVDGQGASLPVAAALFQRFEELSQFAKRTLSLAPLSLQVRNVVMKADDPEKLLFDDLPTSLGDHLAPDVVYQALLDAEASYPKLLIDLRHGLAKALGIDVDTFAGIAERAAVLKGLTNDYNFDAFADRVAAMELGKGDIESTVSVLLHRPARVWSDRDRQEALTEIARYGRRFRELEALAIVRDRRSQTEAVALVVGLDPKMPPLVRSFELSETEKDTAASIADRLVASLRSENENGRLQLAALARAVAMMAAEGDEEVTI